MADGTVTQGRRYTTDQLDKLPIGTMLISSTASMRKTPQGWHDGKQYFKATSFTMTNLSFAHEQQPAISAPVVAPVTMSAMAALKAIAPPPEKPAKGKGKAKQPVRASVAKAYGISTPKPVAAPEVKPAPPQPMRGPWVAPDKPYVMPVEDEVAKALRMFPSAAFPLDDIRGFIREVEKSTLTVGAAKALAAMRYLLTEAEETATLRASVEELEALTDEQHKKYEELEGDRKDDEDKHEEYVKDLIQQHKDYIDDLTNDHEATERELKVRITELEQAALGNPDYVDSKGNPV